jgi:predicted dehydrogenase
MRTFAKTNRREFLERSARIASAVLAVPYAVPGSALGKDGETAPSERITLGSIGVGSMGRGDMKGLMQAGGVQILAVCDVFEDRQEKAKAIADEQYGNRDCKMYGDFREILAREDIDAVCITTQDHWHALIAVAAAKAGKDMYCQKPLGVTVAECQAIRAAVRKHGRIFQTGTQQRSDDKFRHACELARNGYLGKLHTVEVAAPGPMYQRKYDKPTTPEPIPEGFDFDMFMGPAKMRPYNGGLWAWPDWYLIRDYCVGFIVNWGVHHLDIANWGCPTVTSEPCELEFKGSYRTDGLTDNINDWTGEFRYESGLKMTYSDTGNPNQQGCIFRGDKGWVHVDRPRILAEPESLLNVELKSDELSLSAGANGSHYNNFIECVRSRKDPIAPVEAGVQASYLGMIAELSIKLGRPLRWDPKTETFPGDAEANRLLSAPMRSPWKLADEA